MGHSKKSPEDYLDDFFNEVGDNLESAGDFAKRVKKELNSSFESKRYGEQLTDLLNQSLDTAKRYIGAEAEQSGFSKPEKIQDGFSFVQNELANISYELRRRGSYKDGHQKALRQYYLLMEQDPKCFLRVEAMIQSDLAEKKEGHRRKDRFNEGYIAGLNALLHILKEAKIFMFQRVQQDLLSLER